MSQTLAERIELLSTEERDQIKTRAKVIKDEIFNRAPQFVMQPYDDMVNQICVSATFDDWESGQDINDTATLLDVRDMLHGYGDRLDVMALMVTNDDAVMTIRNKEDNFRKLANIIDTMVDDGFVITSKCAPTP